MFKLTWNIITAVKNAIGNIVFLALIVLVIVALANIDSPEVPDVAILKINPDGRIVEQKREVDPFQLALAGDQQEREVLLRDLVEAIELAAEDERIKAINLSVGDLGGGSLSAYEEIARALDKFKATGKPVLSFASQYSQSKYLMASNATEVYLDKDSHAFLGGVFMTGFGTYPLYFKSALDKLRIQVHVFKAGNYKDAAESFIRDDMSEFSREATTAYLSGLWNDYLLKIATQRELTEAGLRNYISQYTTLLEQAGREPGIVAVEQGLVDALITRQEWSDRLDEVAGEDRETIAFKNYLAIERSGFDIDAPGTEKVAVIVAKGVILDGDLPAGDIGDESMADLIKQARDDDSVKALVVRIDSPGGSASASERIRTELQAVREKGKPVVASMGGLAASGGYWIAATSDRILASSSTLTGSIGVFALVPTLNASLAELGIYADGVGTTELSGAFDPFRPLNPSLDRLLDQSVGHTYDKFLSIVSEGRGMTPEQVDEIAQGRVWIGAKAVELGLVDEIGGIDDAIAAAAELAELEDYEVTYVEKELDPAEQFLLELAENVRVKLPWTGLALPGALQDVPSELKPVLEGLRGSERGEPVMLSQCLDCKISF